MASKKAFIVYLKQYLATIALLMLLNWLWLIVIVPMFQDNYPGYMLSPRILFFCYLLYSAVLVFFVLQPALKANSLAVAVLRGAGLGLASYSLYEFVNFATLQEWPANIGLVCIAWGILLTTIVSVVAFYIFKK